MADQAHTPPHTATNRNAIFRPKQAMTTRKLKSCFSIKQNYSYNTSSKLSILESISHFRPCIQDSQECRPEDKVQ